MKADRDLVVFLKINSKWTIDQSIRHKTTKLLADNIGENLDDPGFGDDF